MHKLSAEVALAAITGDDKHWEEAYHSERLEQDYFILARLEDLLPKSNHLVLAFIFRYAGIYEPALYTKAAEEALKVLDGDPKNFDALMTIGTAYQRIGRLPEAERYTQQARDLYPKSGEPSSRLAEYRVAEAETGSSDQSFLSWKRRQARSCQCERTSTIWAGCTIASVKRQRLRRSISAR